MQTFLPHQDFTESAKVLDRARLNKQRSECKQILHALRYGGGWRNHPAVKMWAGYEAALCVYAIEICREWRRRGYQDELLEYFLSELEAIGGNEQAHVIPPWIGGRIHTTHRSNLLRKNNNHYSQFGWSETPDMSYHWPTKGD